MQPSKYVIIISAIFSVISSMPVNAQANNSSAYDAMTKTMNTRYSAISDSLQSSQGNPYEMIGAIKSAIDFSKRYTPRIGEFTKSSSSTELVRRLSSDLVDALDEVESQCGQYHEIMMKSYDYQSSSGVAVLITSAFTGQMQSSRGRCVKTWITLGGKI